MTTTPHSPLFRNFVHVSAFIIFAPVLGALADPRHKIPHGRAIVAGFLFFITLLNLLVLPRLESGRRIARTPLPQPLSPIRGRGEPDWGPWLYPLALVLCFLLFPPFAAMGAWAALAAGDAAASFAGRNLPWPKLPWNPRKSGVGMLAFILGALPFCLFALWWTPCPLFLRASGAPEWPFVWTLAVLAAFTGAILESLDGPFDDNLRVPLGVGAALWLAANFLSFATRKLPYDTPVQPEVFLHALAINGALGLGVILLRFADIPGALLGASIGTIIFFFTQWPGYLLFMLFVVAGSLLSKIGLKRKTEIGAAEARQGKRGIRNVAANLIVPALCCLAYPASGGDPAFLLAFAGALAAAFADTASSEIGTLSKSQPVLITSLKSVAPGTNGAISSLGCAAALAASLLLAGVAWQHGFLARTGANPSLGVTIITVAGLIGTTADSFLGATVEDRLPGVGKGAVNFCCTLAGAAVGGGMGWLLR